MTCSKKGLATSTPGDPPTVCDTSVRAYHLNEGYPSRP